MNLLSVEIERLRQNERTKYLASALDRASTALVTVGVLVPFANLIVRHEGGNLVAIIAGGSLFLALILHLTGRWTLGRLI